MADDKMKTEKPKSKASVLYDRGKEKTQDVTDRKDEAAGAAKADMAKKDDKAEAGEDAGLKTALAGAGKLIEGLKALHKAHETERRDYHGNHREALRQMAGRHEKQIKDMMDQHMAGMGEAAPAADAGAAPAAAAAAAPAAAEA